MKISICMLSYNHARFIGQAIEGVIEQSAKFDFELIIGDDCSTDGTVLILEKYQQLYPDKIKLILRQNNVGMMKNFISTLNACEGEYVAICEGDDYWIDKEKLQLQVDFLDKNIDYVICFHRVYEQIGDNKQLSPDNPWDKEETLTISDLTNGNFMHTNSVVYRNNLFNEFPDWYDKSPIGDYVLHLLNARYGLIKYFPKPMGVYRKLSGTWSSQTKLKQMKQVVQVLDYLLLEDFDSKVLKSLYIYRVNLFNEYCLTLLRNDDLSYLPEMEYMVKDESNFIQDWMLHYYPDRIKAILSSKTYKFAAMLSNIKSKTGL